MAVCAAVRSRTLFTVRVYSVDGACVLVVSVTVSRVYGSRTALSTDSPPLTA